jgi:EAL domain-containing protein (putative c-di-GMP-specific phosphodiesterase class I)
MRIDRSSDDLFVGAGQKRRLFAGLGARLAHRHQDLPKDEQADSDLERMRIWRELKLQLKRQIQSTIANRSLEMHFQPIVDLRSGRQVGAEALSRFTGSPTRAPDKWFADAASVGLGVELEIVALQMALEQMHLLPSTFYLSLNASVETIMSEQFQTLFADVASERIILELTEHTQVDDYPKFEQSIIGIRTGGVRLAVDDAGSGYSSLQHILQLKPDIIKLDIGLTRGIDKDPARRALGRALLSFGLDAYGASFVAEGIETQGEFDTLRSLGCPAGQGYYLGRPRRLGMQHLASIAAMPLRADPGARGARGARSNNQPVRFNLAVENEALGEARVRNGRS